MTDARELPGVARRFLRYVRIDTQSDRASTSTPSTEKQKELGRLLVAELLALGAADVEMDQHGYVYADLESNMAEDLASAVPALALLAHIDTSPDESGGPVKPLVHPHYDGSILALAGDASVKLDPERSPKLREHLGHDLITSDGTTLLGSDDKAGIAIILQTVEELLAAPDFPRPRLRICFTVDEEIGRGVDKLDLGRLGADVAYTVDGGSVGHIDTETFNAAEATVRVQGVMVHPGTAKGVMANAAMILCEILGALPRSETPEATEKREGYFCPHQLSGSIARAETKILLRDFTDAGLDRRKQMLVRLVDFARLEHPRATIELEIQDNYKNLRRYVEQADPRAFAFAFAAGRALGLQLEEQSIRGGTDGSRLSELGLPTPNLFTGGHDYHSRFEWNTVQNLEISVRYLKELIRHWAEHGAQSPARSGP